MGLIGEVTDLPVLKGAIDGDQSFDGASKPEAEKLCAFKGLKDFGAGPFQRD